MFFVNTTALSFNTVKNGIREFKLHVYAKRIKVIENFSK